MYTTEQHVYIYWTPQFDSCVVSIPAKRWGEKGGRIVIYNTVHW